MADVLKLNTYLGSSAHVDFDDVLNAKTFLHRMGYYEPPEWGITKYPDDALFNAIKAFQKDRGLYVDGIMKPGGETEAALNVPVRRAAETLRRQGRFGDTMLVHLSPAQANLLHTVTDGGSVNPNTGLLEFWDESRFEDDDDWGDWNNDNTPSGSHTPDTNNGNGNGDDDDDGFSFFDNLFEDLGNLFSGNTTSPHSAHDVRNANAMVAKYGGRQEDYLRGGYYGPGGLGYRPGALREAGATQNTNDRNRAIQARQHAYIQDRKAQRQSSLLDVAPPAQTTAHRDAFLPDTNRDTRTRPAPGGLLGLGNQPSPGGLRANANPSAAGERPSVLNARTQPALGGQAPRPDQGYINAELNRIAERKRAERAPGQTASHTVQRSLHPGPGQKPGGMKVYDDAILRDARKAGTSNTTAQRNIATERHPAYGLSDTGKNLLAERNRTGLYATAPAEDWDEQAFLERNPEFPSATPSTAPDSLLSAETVASNIRTAEALSKSTDFSAILPHITNALKNGGASGQAEVLDLMIKTEQRKPGHGLKLARDLEVFLKKENTPPAPPVYGEFIATGPTRSSRAPRTFMEEVNRFYQGVTPPELRQQLEGLVDMGAWALETLSPGADVKDALTFSGQTSLKALNGDFLGALTDLGYTTAAIIGMAVPGSVGGYKKGADKVVENIEEIAEKLAKGDFNKNFTLAPKGSVLEKDLVDYFKSDQFRKDLELRQSLQAQGKTMSKPYGFFDHMKDYKGLRNRKKKAVTNDLKGSKERIFVWDPMHGGEMEVYKRVGKSKKLEHLGVMDPITGQMIKGPVKGRIEKLAYNVYSDQNRYV